MAETPASNTDGKSRRTLSLNRTVESGQVRQSFSHGRSKAVVVEKKRRRVVAADEAQQAQQAETTPPPSPAGLSSAEQQAREAALAKAKQRTEDAPASPSPARVGRKVERPEPKPAKAKKDSAPAKTAKKPAPSKAPPPAKPAPKGKAPARPARDDEKREQKRSARKQERPRREGKLTITDALNDDEERMRSLASIKRWRERSQRHQKADTANPAKVSRQVVIPESISVQELASRMATRVGDVIKALMEQGMMVEINSSLDADTAQLIAEEMGHSVRRIAEADVEEGVATTQDADADLQPRPPVVTVMGHVDHGKTSLLDAVRETSVVKGEAGGITQHIGAYQATHQKQVITFLDTPGHAAFTQMRARGSKLTDIVVLVVAADDGVMPQTEEAIAHAQAAEVPMIVAINKMDAAGANVEKVKSSLMQKGVMLEGAGGEVQWVEISALKKQGLDKLLDAILLQAELLNLKANPNRVADGIVLESRLDKGRGALATILIRGGTLKKGDVFVVGQTAGRVRAMTDSQRQPLKEATPAMPVEVLGASISPQAGDVFNVVEDEGKAREVAEYRERVAREAGKAEANPRANLAQMLAEQNTETEELAVIVKADAQGSAEAFAHSLSEMGEDDAKINVIHSAVGEITENDVLLAKASQAAVIGFHVRANAQARRLAEAEKISLYYHTIIYEALDEMKALLEGKLKPLTEQLVLGKAEVLEVFTISGKTKIAGSRVLEGAIKQGAKARVQRGAEVLGEADIETLQHFKDKVGEVKSGQECGIGLKDFEELQAGDQIQCFEVKETARQLA